MITALIAASGTGSRVGREIPKQFIIVGGKPIFLYSVLAFQNNQKIDNIIIITKKEYFNQVDFWCKKFNVTKLKGVIEGGNTRQESILNGLNAIKDFSNEYDRVLIHDAARPLLNEKIINDNISALDFSKAVCTAIKASDTLYESEDGYRVKNMLNREVIYQAQTPQSFIYKVILDVHLKSKEEGFESSDDASLAKHYGIDVQLVEGSPLNFKITTSNDLDFFESIIENEN